MKRRRNTSTCQMRAVVSRRRDTHDYDFSGCKGVSRSCNLKKALKSHARSGGSSGVSLLSSTARLGFSCPKEKNFEAWAVPCVVPRLPWHWQDAVPSAGTWPHALDSGTDPPLSGLCISSPFPHFFGPSTGGFAWRCNIC